MPEPTSQLDPELADLIERQVELVRQAPRDARQRAVLGLIYEANDLWSEARSCYRHATAMDQSEPMWPHHAAIAWLKMGDIDGAAAWMREHARRFTTFAPLQHRLGATLLETDQTEEAAAAFRNVMASAPNRAEGYVGYAEARLRASDPAEAARTLEQAVTIDPGYKTARFLLGRAYRALGRMQEAKREMTLGMGATTRYLPDAWSAKRPKYAVGYGKQMVRAEGYFSAGRPALAAEILERLRESRPNDVDILINLGTAYLHMGRVEQAHTTLLLAERLDKGRFETYINLAACALRRKRLTDALQYAETAVALAPEVAQTHHTRGLMQMQLGANEEALESLGMALSLDARNPKTVQDLANVCMRLRRYPEALGHFHTLAGLLPERWEPQLGVARVNLFLGRFHEAEAALDVGLKMAPNEPQLHALAKRLAQAQGM